MADNHSPSPSSSIEAGQSSCPADDQSDSNVQSLEITKNDYPIDSPLPSYITDINNCLLLKEASKLIQIGLEKDFVLSEKSKSLEEANETIDNLRKNIVDLQMEYETLDQNYNKEMAYREEVIKSIETTRNMIESAVEYSNTLAASIKQLDEDKYKLIEFYDIIYQRQEETERKHKDIKTVVSQQEDTIKRGALAAESEKRAVERSDLLTMELLQTQIMFKNETEIKKELEADVERWKSKADEIRSALLSEQKSKIRYQTNYLHIRKKMIENNTKNTKLWRIRKAFYKKNIKVLNTKLEILQENLDESNKNVLKYLDIIKVMEEKVGCLEKDLEVVSSNNQKTIKELDETLKSSLSEKDSLASELDKLRIEISEENLKNKNLEEEYERLGGLYEDMKSKLRKKEDDLNTVLEENLNVNRDIEQLNRQISINIQTITDLENKLQSQNYEQLSDKLSSLERELQNYYEKEERLKKEITLLYEIMNKDSSDVIEKITEQNLGTIFEEVRQILEVQKFENNNLRFRIQELETANSTLSGDLNIMVEREKSRADEHEKVIKKLVNDIENKQKLLESQQEKLSEADNEILELKKLTQKLKENETTITSLRKSLESAKADVESYKGRVKALEIDAKNKKSPADECTRKLEVRQRRQLPQEHENMQKTFETPKRQVVGTVSDIGPNEEIADFLNPMGSTPKPARRLLSTPIRHLRSPFPSPKFKSISPIKKSSDPYEYDSDGSLERCRVLQTSEGFPSKGKNEKSNAKRKK